MSPARGRPERFDMVEAETIVGEMKAFVLLIRETTECGNGLSSDHRDAVFVLAWLMTSHVERLDQLIQSATQR